MLGARRRTLKATYLPSRSNDRALPSHALRQPGSLEEAFEGLFRQNPHAMPSQENFATVLELCASERALSQGQQIHGRILTSGLLSSNDFLGTKLLFMYGKCGCVSSARQLFDEMPRRSIFTWNALMGAYSSSEGRQQEALELYAALRAAGVSPDACTLASLMKSCAAAGDLQCGSEAHGLAIKCGHVSSAFVVNSLVTMYAKCGHFELARRLFEWLPEKEDVVSWNSVISACVQNERWTEALRFFREMQEAGVEANSYTAVGILQACAELFLLKLGRELHASLLKCGQKSEIFVANALVVMYARCGQMGHSVQVFQEMGQKDNVSWNSVLSGYMQNGQHAEVVHFFLRMRDAGCRPDKVSVINAASCLGQLRNLSRGREIHAYAVRHALHGDLQVGNTLIDMYARCSCAEHARRVFDAMPERDHISWTAMIAAHVQSFHYSEAVGSFKDALAAGAKVDAVMLVAVLRAFSAHRCRSQVKEIHAFVTRRGLSDLFLENMLIDAYGECGESGYAASVFERVESKDVISWTSMINACTHNGLLLEALGWLHRFKVSGLQLDAAALVSVLGAVAELSTLRKGKEIHGLAIRRGFTVDPSLVNSLVDMYARCGDVEACRKLFDRVERKDLVLWTTIIDANGMHGRGAEAVALFEEMQKTGTLPDHICFLALLYACSHSGLPDEGMGYLELMQNGYKLEPWPEHYACAVDMLSRSGRVDEAYEFIAGMPAAPTAPVWCALLGGCRVYSNSRVGRVAAQRLLELEPENPGNYVLASNVFAAAGRWAEVDETRRRMTAKGLKKSPACSWIEMGNVVHSFVAGDEAHPASAVIYSKLAEITGELEGRFGYRPDTRYALRDLGDGEKAELLGRHSERLAITLGLIGASGGGAPIRVTKNLRVCGDCHEFTKLVSRLFQRDVILRDANRFHHFKDGSCSCGDFW